MRVVIAPQSFKGTFPAEVVAEALRRGVKQAIPDAHISLAPVADGGEGTLSAIVSLGGGSLRESVVSGPAGDSTVATWGIIGSGTTAVIETAEVIGITKVDPESRNICELSSMGVGQLILEALDLGLRDFIIAVGGTATNDGGLGLLRELGFTFIATDGHVMRGGPCCLETLSSVDQTTVDPRLAMSRFEVLCDGNIPVTGPRGASLSRSQQKGAVGDEPERLEQGMANFARVASTVAGRDVASTPMAGCGGAIAGGLMGYLDATLTLGIERVAALAGLESMIEAADLVITGEGRADDQTAEGKAPIGVARLAKRYQVPVLLVAAQTGTGHEQLSALGVTEVLRLTDQGESPLRSDHFATEQMITSAVAAWLREWRN